MERLEEINRKLAAIQDQLLQLGDDEFEVKNQLHIERDRLRDEAKSYQQDRDATRPSSELIRELKQRQSQLASISKRHINPAKAADGSFSGIGLDNGPADAQAINRNIDGGTDRGNVERRISHLESILKERGHL